MKTTTLVVLLFVAGCGSSTLTCAQADRDGTYLLASTTVSGTCGDVPSQLVQMRAGVQVLATGCSLDYERWSNGDCKAERSVTCTSTADNLKTVGVVVINESSTGGAEYTGTVSLTITQLTTGAAVCIGTYAVSYKRQ